MSLPTWMQTLLARLTRRNPEGELVRAEAGDQDEGLLTDPSALPLALADRIERVVADLRDGTPGRTDLDAAVAGLAALAPASVAAVGAAVADRLRPLEGRWASPGVLRERRRSDLARLGAIDGIEHLFIFHPDGHVREAALRRLHGPARTAFDVAAIAYRLNDWAAPVRAAARDCATRVFPRTGADVLVEALLFLLDRMHEWQRWQQEGEDAAGNRAILDALMVRPDVCGRLVAHLGKARTGRMGRLLRLACRWPSLDTALPDLARRAVLPDVRACALRFLIEERATWPEGFRWDWVDKSYGLARRVRVIGERRFDRNSGLELETLIAQGAQDRSAIVRRVAGDALVRHRSGLDDARLALVRQLADDKSPSVRERAAFILKERAAR